MGEARLPMIGQLITLRSTVGDNRKIVASCQLSTPSPVIQRQKLTFPPLLSTTTPRGVIFDQPKAQNTDLNRRHMDGINLGHASSGRGIQNIVFACVDADRSHTSKYLNCLSHLPFHATSPFQRSSFIVCWGFCLGLCWWPICILWGIARNILSVRGQEEMERIRNHLDAVDVVFYKYWPLLCNYTVASFKSACNSITLTDLTNLDGA